MGLIFAGCLMTLVVLLIVCRCFFAWVVLFFVVVCLLVVNFVISFLCFSFWVDVWSLALLKFVSLFLLVGGN